jgi:hypothetical protein
MNRPLKAICEGTVLQRSADVLKKILVEATDLLLSLEGHFLQSSSDAPAT